jgi:hypothetical protein
MISVSASPLQGTVREWEVVDLLLSDDRVVQHMFEAIVAAEWAPAPGPPTPTPVGAMSIPADTSDFGSTVRRAVRARSQPPNRPGTDGWARERSPPKNLPGRTVDHR